jgi:AAA family ATPase
MNAPSLIFIDEIDALCPKREQSNSETEKRVVAALLTLMDGVEDGGGGGGDNAAASDGENFVVIGATNRPNAVDPALRRPGRLDVEIEIGIPNVSDRLAILRIHLQRMPTQFTEEQLRHVAEITHGYVGADLAALCREAGMRALKRGGDQPAVCLEDLLHGKHAVPPSAMREIAVEIPNVHWDDIGGQEEVKQKLRESIEWPLKYPQAFAKLGLSPPKGILLYGPPGCSKTMMAKALATESGLNFIAVKGPELFNKYVGESERALKEVFRKARAASPSIVFFDEIDAIASSRGGMKGDGGGPTTSSVSDRVLTLLLTELDGFEALNDVTLVCATNLPNALDPALLRPGRIDRMIYVSPPDYPGRLSILQIRSRKMPLASDVDLEWLAGQSEGMSGAEVASICQEAAMYAIQQDPVGVQSVEMKDFRKAILSVRPQITPEMLAFYQRFGQSQGARNL